MSYPEIFSREEDFFEIFLFSHDYKKQHRHNYIEFIFVVEGRGKEEVNGRWQPLEKGVLSIILPYQYHRIVQDQDSILKYYSVALSMDYFMQSSKKTNWYTDLLGVLDQFALPLRFQGQPLLNMEDHLENMLNEYHQKNQWWNEAIEAYLTILFVAIRREIEQTHRNANQGEKQTDKDSLIWEIMKYLYCHFDEEISLKQLSQIFNIHSTYISNRVKAVTGQNYYDYLTEIRLKNAASLMKTSDMKMVDIAHASGYQSYRSFVRAFEKHYHQSPSEYKGND